MLTRMFRQFFGSVGYARFRHERSAFEVKLALAEVGGLDWAHAARKFTNEADKYFEASDLDGAWLCLRDGMRQELLTLPDHQLVNAELVLRSESAKVQSEWRKEAIGKLFATETGSRALRLERAQEILDDYYQTQYYRNALMRSQLVTLVYVSLAALTVLLVLIGITGTGLDTWETWDWKTLLVVFLAGVLGASFSATRKLGDEKDTSEKRNSKIPEMAAARSSTLARIVLGAVPALAAYAFLKTEILTVKGYQANPVAVMLAVSFAAGFSERFVLNLLGSFDKAGGTEARK